MTVKKELKSNLLLLLAAAYKVYSSTAVLEIYFFWRTEGV